tara:strand:- start:629 stop:1792 length:1164 start_codon:yes stop_codon:yes gene_type:complete
MKKVLLRAPVLSKSGYGEHSRQILRYLLEKPNLDVSIQVLHWGMTPWSVNHDDENGLIGEALKRTAPDDAKNYDVSIQVQLPNEWDTTYAKYNVGVTAGVETDICSPLWTSVHCEKMDKVIVPSEHTKKTLVKSALTKVNIDVVPEAYYEELRNDYDDLSLNLDTKFNFLTVGVLTGQNPYTDRKNLFFLIKWFVEEFRNNPNVGLIVKTNSGRDTSVDKHGTKNLLKKVLKEIGHDSFPRVYLLHGSMSRSEMTSLYKDESVKAFISCTRGEGFGLPFLESAVAGLPVIATDWSAHTEFLNKGKWIKVENKLEPIHNSKIDNNIFVQGARWAECSELDFKKKISTFYKKPHTPTKWAKELSSELIETHSFRTISKKYDEVLGEVLS